MTAASRDNAAPILSVLLESVTLERINLVSNDAGDGHEMSLLFVAVCQLLNKDTSSTIKV